MSDNPDRMDRTPRVLADGRILQMTPLLYGGWELSITKVDEVPCVKSDAWHYSASGTDGYPDSTIARILCFFAFCSWDGTGEPAAWTRHPASGRRRPQGAASMEYLRA